MEADLQWEGELAAAENRLNGPTGTSTVQRLKSTIVSACGVGNPQQFWPVWNTVALLDGPFEYILAQKKECVMLHQQNENTEISADTGKHIFKSKSLHVHFVSF